MEMGNQPIAGAGSELDMYHCGMEDCAPGHYFGPAVRDHFLIHYIRSGKGVFQVGSRRYRLERGQGFLICPDIVTFYQADAEEPWHYSWVGFHGAKAEGYLKQTRLDQVNPIFAYHQDEFFSDCLNRMVAASQAAKGREVKLKGLLYLFLAKLIEIADHDSVFDGTLSKKELYIKDAVEYIRMNYSRKISIAQMARFIGLDRSYLCLLFKELLKVSPQRYLIDFRMAKAGELMKNDALSIGDIARSVGYEDQLQFSKLFRKVRGVSPRQYRSGLKVEG